MKFIHILFVIPILIACYSCEEKVSPENLLPAKLVKAKGNKFYGKTLHVNSIEKVDVLFPASITDVYSQHVSSQIYEGLLKFNSKNLELEPCIAKSFEIDETNTIYTFDLRKDVYFQDNACFKKGIGRQVISSDIKYVFEFICSNHKMNASSNLWQNSIKGAKLFSEKKTHHVEGIKIIDDFTISIELNKPNSSFLNTLALNQTSIFPKEAFEKYQDKLTKEHSVGTGPYIVKQLNDTIILERNLKYWKQDDFGNQLPFISYIEIQFKNDKTKELESFKKGSLDFIWGIPVEEIDNAIGSLENAKEGLNKEFVVQSINSLQVEFYGFLLNDSLYSNIHFRKAINYAIDRKYITTFILEGAAEPATSGIIPEMKGYPSDFIDGYGYFPELAKKHLRKAGFNPDKNNLKIQFHYNKSGQINQMVALEIKRQVFYNLGIQMELVEIDRSDLINQIENKKVAFWRFGWIADYPDPANFISQFHSNNISVENNSLSNFCGYSNPKFDSYFDDAMAELDQQKRYELLAQAEQVLISDAAIIPLFYYNSIRLVNPELHNFPINELEFRDYSTVYFSNKTKKKVRNYDNLSQ